MRTQMNVSTSVAVQIVHVSRRGVRDIEHLGSDSDCADTGLCGAQQLGHRQLGEPRASPLACLLDGELGPQRVAGLAEAVPNARTTTVDGSDHLLPLRNPSALAAIAADFMGKHRIAAIA